MAIQVKNQKGDTENQLTKMIALISNLNEVNKLEYLKIDLINRTQVPIKEDIYKYFEAKVRQQLGKANVTYETHMNFVDDMLSTLDMVCLIKSPHDDDFYRIGLHIFNKYHYKQQHRGKDMENLTVQTQTKLSILEDIIFWNIILVDEVAWSQLSPQQKQEFFDEHLEIDLSEGK